MGKTINTKLDDGLLTFTFTNSEGEVFSSFKMNPTDVKLAKRCGEISDFFEKRAIEIEDGEKPSSALACFNQELEEKFDYLLGYQASKTLFPAPYTATTVFPNGSIFAFVIMKVISDALAPELEKRNKKMQAKVAKHLKNYQ